MTTSLRRLIAGERRRQRGLLLLAGASAAAVAAASVVLLGLSGWFITASALAGMAGAGAATAFNTLLPSAAIRLLAIARTGCRYTERLSAHDAALRALARIRPALFLALTAAPPGTALAMSAGDALARVVQDVGEVEHRLVRGSSAWAAVAACAAGAALLQLAGVATLAAVLALVATLLIVAWRLSVRLEHHGHAVPRANGELRQEFASLLVAAPELRAYGLEDWAASRVCQRARTLVAAQQRVTASGGWFEVLIATATGLAAMLALGMAHRASLPVAALAALGAGMTIEGVGSYARGFQRRGQSREAEARLGALLGAVTVPRNFQPMPKSRVLGLCDIASLAPGSIVGITGPSGSGKTTLLERLLRLRSVENGRIAIGGVEINDLDPRVVRSIFTVAPQDAALLDGSVRENLLLARPAATDVDLWDALRDAALDDWVRGRRDGLDARLGENGARLSGGERRRLVLARAYLRESPWLLLDEPTEGMDKRTEAVVVERLRVRLARRGQGAILVSHRAAPLAICERVFTLGSPILSRPAAVS